MSVAFASSSLGRDTCVNCRVLVVEDDAVCQDVLLMMLAGLGYGADVANDGVDALSAIRAAHYDVVLMDVRMPRMDGMEAARRIRTELDGTDQPTIVAMTADTTLRCQEECLQSGMDGHLGKPVHIGDLAAALENRDLRQWKLEPVIEPGHLGGCPTPASPAAVVYDAGVLESLLAELGADEGIRSGLIESFILDSQERLIAIAGAAEVDDLGALGFEAHAIKSASAAIGLLALSEVARQIEEAAKGTPGEVDVGPQASRLAVECHRAIEALSAAFLAEPG